jgi:shikimate dehydrogenase
MDADPRSMDIVLNASPLGMRAADAHPVPLELLRKGQFIGDVVTEPASPPLIEAARRLGLAHSTGVAMFAKVRDLMLDHLLDAPDPARFKPVAV